MLRMHRQRPLGSGFSDGELHASVSPHLCGEAQSADDSRLLSCSRPALRSTRVFAPHNPQYPQPSRTVSRSRTAATCREVGATRDHGCSGPPTPISEPHTRSGRGALAETRLLLVAFEALKAESARSHPRSNRLHVIGQSTGVGIGSAFDKHMGDGYTPPEYDPPQYSVPESHRRPSDGGDPVLLLQLPLAAHREPRVRISVLRGRWCRASFSKPDKGPRALALRMLPRQAGEQWRDLRLRANERHIRPAP
jgi:hypothetical protein